MMKLGIVAEKWLEFDASLIHGRCYNVTSIRKLNS